MLACYSIAWNGVWYFITVFIVDMLSKLDICYCNLGNTFFLKVLQVYCVNVVYYDVLPKLFYWKHLFPENKTFFHASCVKSPFIVFVFFTAKAEKVLAKKKKNINTQTVEPSKDTKWHGYIHSSVHFQLKLLLLNKEIVAFVKNTGEAKQRKLIETMGCY